MKSNRTLIIVLAASLLAYIGTVLRADDWQTTDGKFYQNVTVVAVAPDVVTILHHDGGTMVPLATLSPELQKRFAYDPVKAKAAAEQRASAEAADRRAMRDRELAAEQKLAEAATDDDGQTAIGSSTSTGSIAAPASTATSADGYTGGDAAFTEYLTRLSLKNAPYDVPNYRITNLAPLNLATPADSSDGDDSSSAGFLANLSLDPGPSDTHYKMSTIAIPKLSLRRDLNDPGYHTMAHAVYMIRIERLGPDLSDPKHHTMDEIAP